MPSNQEVVRSTDDTTYHAPGATGVDWDHPAAAHVQILDADAGRVDILGTGRKNIAICGFASSSRHRMPFDDPTWIIVGLNQLYRHIPRADVWFDIHSNWADPADNVPNTDHPRYLRECQFPVFMIERQSDTPTSVRYPLDRMIQKQGLDYFTSTVAFMAAWAIDEIEYCVMRRAEAAGLSDYASLKRLFGEYTLGIFGIDLIVGDEYFYQKPCVEFWLGVAGGLGIQVYLPPETALCKQLYRYGYERDPGGTQFLPVRELNTRRASMERERNALMAKLQTLDGAMQENGYLCQVGDLRSKGGAIPISPVTGLATP